MSLRGIFDPMVRAYFKNQFGGGGSGTSNFKYRILSSSKEEYSAEIDFMGAGTLKKVAEYFEPTYLGDENIGFLSNTYPNANDGLSRTAWPIQKNYNGWGGFQGEVGMWNISTGTEGVPFCLGVSADVIPVFAEAGLMIPEAGVYVLQPYVQSSFVIVFYEYDAASFGELVYSASDDSQLHVTNTTELSFLEVGQTYTVEIYGAPFECVCSEADGYRYLGDPALINGGNPTNAWFVVYHNVSSGYGGIDNVQPITKIAIYKKG